MRTRSAGRLAAVTLGVALAFAGLGCRSDSDSDRERQTGGSRSSPGSSVQDAEELLARLRSGGLVIVFRHAATDRSDDDDPEVDRGAELEALAIDALIGARDRAGS
jgi:hypothetical protein